MERTGLWDNKGSDTPMLPLEIDQMKVSHETGSEANVGLGRALMPSYLEMCPQSSIFQFSDTVNTSYRVKASVTCRRQ